MAKKVNPKAAAKRAVEYKGSVDEAVEHFRNARAMASESGDKEAVGIYDQCIAEAEKLRG